MVDPRRDGVGSREPLPFSEVPVVLFSRDAAKTLRFFGGGEMHTYTHSFSRALSSLSRLRVFP